MVAMETFKNEIFVLSSFFCLNWYIICKNSEKKIFVRPNPEAPYAMIQHTEKIFHIAMEMSKTKLFVLSLLRGIQKYIICPYSEKINFSLGLELGYPILLQRINFLWLLWRRPRLIYSNSAR